MSVLMKGDARVVARFASVKRSDVSVPQPVIAELAYGLERLPRSKRRDTLRARYDLIRGEISRAAWTDEVSAHFGLVKAHLERTGTRITRSSAWKRLARSASRAA